MMIPLGEQSRHEERRDAKNLPPNGIRQELLLLRERVVEVIEMLLSTNVAPHAVRVSRTEVIGDDGALVVGDEIHAVEAENVEQRDELLGDSLRTVITRCLLTLPVALQVDREYPVVARQVVDLSVPREPGARKTVQQNDRLSLTGLDEVPGDGPAVSGRVYEAMHRARRTENLDVAVLVRRWPPDSEQRHRVLNRRYEPSRQTSTVAFPIADFVTLSVQACGEFPMEKICHAFR